ALRAASRWQVPRAGTSDRRGDRASRLLPRTPPLYPRREFCGVCGNGRASGRRIGGMLTLTTNGRTGQGGGQLVCNPRNGDAAFRDDLFRNESEAHAVHFLPSTKPRICATASCILNSMNILPNSSRGLLTD